MTRLLERFLRFGSLRGTNQIFRRSRNDFSGLGKAASHRDHDAIMEDLKADEEPELLPIRRKRRPFRREARPRAAASQPLISGWAFVDSARDRSRLSLKRIPSGIAHAWHEIEFEFDYDDLAVDGFMALSPEGVIKVQHNKKATLNDWMFYRSNQWRK